MDVRYKLALIGSAAFIVVGLMVITWGFRDLPIDERPEGMVVQMVIWPIVALGVIQVPRALRFVHNGGRLHVDRWHLLTHGLPALVISVSPAGLFTSWVGSASMWAFLDFPTAKVMAAWWLASTVWTAWEAVP